MSIPAHRFLFVSYSQSDSGPVAKFLRVLRAEIASAKLELDLWRDRDNLLPGMVWESSIRKALDEAAGLLVFVSDSSFRSKWVSAEIEAVLKASDRPVIPILLDSPLNVPESLRHRQWIDLSDSRGSESKMRLGAQQVLKAFKPHLAAPPTHPLSSEQSSKFAAFVAEAARKQESIPRGPAADHPPDSVFVVHGHDATTLTSVCDTLKEIGVRPIVLSQSLGQSQSLLQKFLDVAHSARFAVVLLCSDDYGVSRRQYDVAGVGDRALQFRARQNVVLELGFFYGRLGWENVFVLWKDGPDVFPNFERPSDLDGAVFDVIDERGDWKGTLESKLREAGFALADSAAREA